MAEDESSDNPISKRSYLIGLIVILACAYSQYLFESLDLVYKLLIVYGVPLLAVSLLWGSAIIYRAFNHILSAVKFGMGFFGTFAVLGIIASAFLLSVISTFDPTAISLLNKPNPVLNIPPAFAWIMILASFLIVGPVEEYLFRGFLYGGLLNLFKDQYWLSLAFVSSILFAAIHLYYAFVYGLASLILFTNLVTFGMAMAVTYYLSDGNILVPALIHGLYDATAFLGAATSLDITLILRGSMILIGIAVAIILFIQKILSTR